MRFTLRNLGSLLDTPYDDFIDVRSPSEFAQDHLPGAINLPVLSDEERARVGTIYVRECRFKARKLGAALIAHNASHHLQQTLADKPGSYWPLLYCARGQLRSESFATILSQIGWRVATLDGGYSAYRSAVKSMLYDQPLAPPLVLLDGNTGTAKTELLMLLKNRGLQVVDLEALANHRGSLFGARRDRQPTQKMFESGLAHQLAQLDPDHPLVVEAESSKIGERIVPPSLWEAMERAPRISMQAPLAARANYQATAYADIAEDLGRLDGLLDQLRPFHARELISQWRELAHRGDKEALAAQLMTHHYDPRYTKQRARQHPRKRYDVELDDLTPETLIATADRLTEVVMDLADQAA